MKKNKFSEFISQIKNGSGEIILEKEFLHILENKKKLLIKVGFDPSSANMHLGHLVLLNKLKIFQEHGHKIVFLIGNFTGMIGDPTGKESTRKMLTEEQVQKNALSYKNQVFKILDEQKVDIKYNADWLKHLTFNDLLKLLSKYTVARILERDDFKKRYKNNRSISIHEFVYPLLQGYDSVHLKSDVEIGGTDQKFNLLVGRELQKRYGQKPQTIITVPLLEGTDGKNKMSKSLNNSIDISDPSSEIFGKTMSINDDLMWKYYALIINKNSKQIKSMKDSCKNGEDKKKLKLNLAFLITKMLHGEKIAKLEKDNFENQFKEKKQPIVMQELEVKTSEKLLKLCYIMKKSKICKSSSYAKRLIDQNAVRINDVKVTDSEHSVEVDSNFVLKVGKKCFFKIKIKSQ